MTTTTPESGQTRTTRFGTPRVGMLALVAAAVATVLGLTIAPTVAAETPGTNRVAAQAPKVSLAGSDNQVLVSEKVTFSGRYGPNKSVRVFLQERVKRDQWRTRMNKKTTSRGTYRFTKTMNSPGPKRFRVIVRGKGQARSEPVNVLVERWHSLTDLAPAAEYCKRGGCTSNGVARMNGSSRQDSILFNKTNGTSDQTYALGYECTRFTSLVGMDDRSADGGAMRMVVTSDGVDKYRKVHRMNRDTGAPRRVSRDLTGGRFLTVGFVGIGNKHRSVGAYATPRIRCAF